MTWTKGLKLKGGVWVPYFVPPVLWQRMDFKDKAKLFKTLEKGYKCTK